MITKQDTLIQLLYDEQNATDEQRELIEEIAQCKSIIEKKRFYGMRLK